MARSLLDNVDVHDAGDKLILSSDEEPGAAVNMDLMIAAHARSTGAVLVTNNEKHFRRVEGLKVENWA
jgi:tRNA(fMet)-specific endonuclease VapC